MMRLFFFFFFWATVIIFLFILFYFNLDTFVLKTWISRRVSYFVDILSGIEDIFLPGCPQVFFSVKRKFRGISKSHKSSIQRGESSYK